MSRALATALDFAGIPALNFVPETVSTLPSTGLYPGRIIWNTATNAAYVYNGNSASWEAFGIAGSLPAHSHAIGDITGLQTALNGKAAASHQHTSSEVSDFATAVNNLISTFVTSGAINAQLDTIAEITGVIQQNKDALAALTASAAKFTADLGNGAATFFDLAHNLNTLDVLVSIYRKSDGAEVIADVVRTGVNVVRVAFAVAPTANQYRAVVRG